MASINLGKVKGEKGVSVRNRGEWSSLAQYENSELYMDMVSYKGSLWTCLVTNTGVEPGEGKTEWIMAARGMASLANNLTTEKTGSALDATQGRVLAGRIEDIKKDSILTLEDLELVTEEGFFVDALAVKELQGTLPIVKEGELWFAVDGGAAQTRTLTFEEPFPDGYALMVDAHITAHENSQYGYVSISYSISKDKIDVSIQNAYGGTVTPCVKITVVGIAI